MVLAQFELIYHTDMEESNFAFVHGINQFLSLTYLKKSSVIIVWSVHI